MPIIDSAKTASDDKAIVPDRACFGLIRKGLYRLNTQQAHEVSLLLVQRCDLNESKVPAPALVTSADAVAAVSQRQRAPTYAQPATSAPPSWLRREPKRTSAGCEAILPAASAWPWPKAVARSTSPGGAKENTPATCATSATE